MSTRIIGRIIGLLGAALALSACHQNGTEFIVDVKTDSVDVSPGNGVCADAAGNCSVRAAVMEANAVPGVEEIKLEDGIVYDLSIAGTSENAGATGDLDITEGVVISGNGTIDANGIDRVIHTLHPSGLIEIDGPNLTGGSAPTGAALHSATPGGVSLIGSIVSDNHAPLGVPVEHASGQIWIWDSTFTGNSGFAAGAIGILAAGAHIQNVTVDGNDGAGIFNLGGTTSVGFSTIVGNDGGGLISGGGTMTVQGTIIDTQTSGPGCSGHHLARLQHRRGIELRYRRSERPHQHRSVARTARRQRRRGPHPRARPLEPGGRPFGPVPPLQHGRHRRTPTEGRGLRRRGRRALLGRRRLRQRHILLRGGTATPTAPTCLGERGLSSATLGG